MKTIKVSPEILARIRRLRGAENAIAKIHKGLRESLGLPEASKATEGEFVLVDGNGNGIGKYTVSHRDGYTVKAGYVGKLT